MRDRLTQVRKSLNLSMEDFGSRIGVSRSAISRLESGSSNFTEQMIKSICREFKVDYLWFTTGEGEMFSDSDDDAMEILDRIMTGEPTFRKNIIKSLALADEDDLAALERIIDFYIKNKADI